MKGALRMKKFQFLLLDAGPIIKLFRLGIWGEFIEKCHVTIARTVVEQCIHTGGGDILDYIDFPFEEAEDKGLIKIIEVKPSVVKSFLDRFALSRKYEVHSGEDETLAYLVDASEDYLLCAADGAVFRVLGFLNKGERGISLEEVLKAISLPHPLEWRFTRKFREKFTRMGEVDSVQS